MGRFGGRSPASETRTIRLAGEEVSYLLKRSPRRATVGLKVDGKGLTVSAPLCAPQSFLDQVLAERAAWLLAKLREWRERQPVPLAWREGEILFYLGGQVRLVPWHGASRRAVTLDGDDLRVAVPPGGGAEEIRRRVQQWYRKEAAKVLRQRLDHYAGRMGLALPKLALSGARTRWGSCNARGDIRLNWRLVQAPISQIDYVVVHELAHIRELNHSPRFWSIVEEFLPHYEAAHRALKRDGERYHRL